MKKFLDQIIVTWEEPDHDEAFMIAGRSLQEVAVIGEKVRAGIYELKKVVDIVCEVKANET